jgi:L-ascorbate metabolism protein UlaG (beta-lactamase superfamily)
LNVGNFQSHQQVHSAIFAGNLIMKIHYYGHSCFEIEVQGKRLLFDPFISPNPLASHINISGLKPDYILVSHGHQDHVADLISIAKQSGATVICSWEISVWLNNKGVDKTHPMNTGGHWIFEFGKVKCVSAIHSSGLPDGTYGGSALGFLLETSEGNFYYAGDTALHYDMRLIGEYKKINFAFFPLGNNFTMGIDNAVIAAEFVKCDNIIGMHYDTFDMIKIDHKEAVTKFETAGKKLTLLPIGETLTY